MHRASQSQQQKSKILNQSHKYFMVFRSSVYLFCFSCYSFCAYINAFIEKICEVGIFCTVVHKQHITIQIFANCCHLETFPRLQGNKTYFGISTFPLDNTRHWHAVIQKGFHFMSTYCTGRSGGRGATASRLRCRHWRNNSLLELQTINRSISQPRRRSY